MTRPRLTALGSVRGVLLLHLIENLGVFLAVLLVVSLQSFDFVLFDKHLHLGRFHDSLRFDDLLPGIVQKLLLVVQPVCGRLHALVQGHVVLAGLDNGIEAILGGDGQRVIRSKCALLHFEDPEKVGLNGEVGSRLSLRFRLVAGEMLGWYPC